MNLVACVRWSLENDAYLEVKPLPLGGVLLSARAKGLMATCFVPEDAPGDELVERYRQLTRRLAVRVGARQVQTSPAL